MKQDQNIPLEKVIVANIVKRLKADGVKFLFKSHGAAFQGAGLPDIILIAPGNGRFVGLEVKRPHLGKVTPLQQAEIDKINAAGGYACVVRSVEEAVAALEAVQGGVAQRDQA